MQSRRLTARFFDEMHVFYLFSLKSMGKHNEFGKEGEKIATDFLIEKGYDIKYKNYRYLKSEIDIIAQKENVLAIVEVRARSNDQIIPIAETITKKKIKLLVMGVIIMSPKMI